jgi:hypothetical protein
VAASGLSEGECTKDQEMVAVQGSVRHPPHLQYDLIYKHLSESEQGKIFKMLYLCN